MILNLWIKKKNCIFILLMKYLVNYLNQHDLARSLNIPLYLADHTVRLIDLSEASDSSSS